MFIYEKLRLHREHKSEKGENKTASPKSGGAVLL